MSYLFETHLHTSQSSSCARVTAEQGVELYLVQGYDGIVVTDHYTQTSMAYYQSRYGAQGEAAQTECFLKGYFAARQAAKNTKLTVLLGMEIRFDDNDNDHLAYGFDPDFLRAHPALYRLGFEAFSDLCRSRGFFFAQAHPFRANCTRRDPAKLMGVETYNGNVRHENHNDLSERFAEENGLVRLAGSDFHQLEDAGRGGIYLSQKPRTGASFARMLRQGRIEGLKCL